MMRRLVCLKCAPQYVEGFPKQKKGVDSSPKETVTAKTGVLKVTIICDYCGIGVRQGAEAVAVSVHTEAAPYFKWEQDYLKTAEEARVDAVDALIRELGA